MSDFDYKGVLLDTSEVSAVEPRWIELQKVTYVFVTMKTGHVITLSAETDDDMALIESLKDKVRLNMRVNSIKANMLVQPLEPPAH